MWRSYAVRVPALLGILLILCALFPHEQQGFLEFCTIQERLSLSQASHDAGYGALQSSYGWRRRTETPIDSLWRVTNRVERFANRTRGFLTVTRLSGCADLGTDFSEDPLTMLMYESFYGPDEFRFLIEGPEIIAPEQMHRGRCLYEFEYEVSTHGNYRFVLYHTRSNYDSADEVSKTFPPLHYDDLLGQQYWIMFAERAAIDVVNSVKVAAAVVPLCPSSPSGRYVVKAVSSRVRQFSHGPPIRFHSRLDSSEHVEWIPYDCSLQGSKLRLRMRVLFVGDSHMRHTFAFFLAQCGAVSRAVKGQKSLSCSDSLVNSDCNGAKLCFFHDTMGSQYESRINATDWDAVVINFGVWPLSYQGHWTVRGYADQVRKFFKYAKSNLLGLCVVWVSSVGYPLRRDPHIVSLNDTRTLVRTSMFNRVATYEANRAGIQSVDAFSLSRALLEHSPDGSHYPFSVFQSPLRKMILTAIRSCETKDV